MAAQLEVLQLRQAQLELRNSVLTHTLDMHNSHVLEVSSVKVCQSSQGLVSACCRLCSVAALQMAVLSVCSPTPWTCTTATC